MDRSSHTLPCLFSQLGLDNTRQGIENFLINHRGIADDVPLAKATFWTASQANFLTEAIAEDSDWAEIVDSLDAQLR